MSETNGIKCNGSKIAIFYEHPEWFKPLFAEMDRRGIAYERLFAHQHAFDAAASKVPYSLVVNRMSPSAHTRGHAQAIPYTLDYLAHLKSIGANVINGYDAALIEFSKARQIGLLQRLGVRHPKTRVVNDTARIIDAASDLAFPVIIKPNIGGSGAGIQLFQDLDELRDAIALETVELGITSVALVQEWLPARDNSIVRVEVLNQRYLYAIRVHLTSATNFNLCPADYCDLPGNQLEPGSAGSPLIESYTPPPEVIATVQHIMRAANIEVGGVEYLVNDRDGDIYFYDINALSNFVANAKEVIGFDPFPRMVDFMETRARLESASVA